MPMLNDQVDLYFHSMMRQAAFHRCLHEVERAFAQAYFPISLRSLAGKRRSEDMWAL